MEVQYMSDVHLEFDHALELLPKIPVNSDILILAGDVSTSEEIKRLEDFLLREAKKFKHVLYVPGNHEFYNCQVHNTEKLLKGICGKDESIELMDRKSVVINNIRFLGCILWSKIAKEFEFDVYGCLADFKCIAYEDTETKECRMLSLEDFDSFFERDLKWLVSSLEDAKRKKQKVVVITHHPPLFEKVCPPKYEGSKTTSGFANDLRKLIEKYSDCIKYWVCGHTHWNFNLDVKGVKVISNQCGYLIKNKPEAKCKDFDIGKTFKV